MKEKKESSFRVYTSHDVAEILMVDEMTVRRYIKTGRLKKLNTIGAIRISHKELDRFINGSENE
jgi:predicted site-specific integrase-resolvase